MSWANEEAKTANLGDERLNNRMAVILSDLGEKPNSSIAQACDGDWAKVTAAYRFFDNDRIHYEDILSSHYDATLERINKEPVVILSQDTSKLTHMINKGPKGIGTLKNMEKDEVMLHPTIALTPERVCLGVVQADIWERTGKSPRSKRRYKPFEEKESAYWVDGYQSACAVQGLAPDTQIISVGDAESDIYELFLESQEYESLTCADWIVRAAQDRCLDTDNKFENKIRSSMGKKWVLGTATITVPARGDCKAREAVLTIRAGRVTLKAPRRAGFKPENISVNVVFASEENPPTDVDEPIDWLLLTSLPVCTFEQACAVLSTYACRWEIEIYFRVLKQGCGVEKLQFEEDRRYANCLAIYMIIAWRVLYLTMAGRANPDADCEIVFSKAEWQILYILVTKEPPPAVPPTLGAAIGMLARFGGFLGRKHDGFPGPMSIWTGLQRLRDFVLAAHSWQMTAAGTADTCV